MVGASRELRTRLEKVFALTTAGLAIGLAAAWAGSRFVEAFLFGVRGNDPGSILTSMLVLIATVSLAGRAPASESIADRPHANPEARIVDFRAVGLRCFFRWTWLRDMDLAKFRQTCKLV